MYKLSATNQVDALTKREQDLGNQIAAKIALQTQTLLRPKTLDPRILEGLAKDIDLVNT
jgi:hypothetical protein